MSAFQDTYFRFTAYIAFDDKHTRLSQPKTSQGTNPPFKENKVTFHGKHNLLLQYHIYPSQHQTAFHDTYLPPTQLYTPLLHIFPFQGTKPPHETHIRLSWLTLHSTANIWLSWQTFTLKWSKQINIIRSENGKHESIIACTFKIFSIMTERIKFPTVLYPYVVQIMARILKNFWYEQNKNNPCLGIFICWLHNGTYSESLTMKTGSKNTLYCTYSYSPNNDRNNKLSILANSYISQIMAHLPR